MQDHICVNEIKQRVKSLYLDENPISSILKISFNTDREDVAQRLREDFLNKVQKGVSMQYKRKKTRVLIEFQEVLPQSMYFTTRSIYLKEMKFDYIQFVVRNLNEEWSTKIQNGTFYFDDVSDVNMNFLLSEPNEYFGNRFAK
jgi:hypothetical protein